MPTKRTVLKLAEPRFSQSLERGLAVLGCFDGKHSVLGIADLADALGLSRSTTHRYAVTLVELGYLEQEPNRKYRLGLRVTDLGMSALNSIPWREHALPHLQRLTRDTGLTTLLGILDGTEVLCVQVARSRGAAVAESELGLHVGSRVPSYCTALGKVLLAYTSDAERKRALDELKLTKRGPNTITAKKRLLQELDSVNERALGIEDQEFASELRALAVPVYDDQAEVTAAIGLISVGETPVEKLVAGYSAALQRAAAKVSTHRSASRN